MSDLNKLKRKAFKNKAVKKEYDKLSMEFEFISQIVAIRSAAGLTQGEVAKKMQTATSNVSRLESGVSNPSWATIQKYAEACGARVQLSVNF